MLLCNVDTIINCLLFLQSDKLAAGLMALGLKRGDRVGIWAPNCMHWVLTQYATARAGIVLVGRANNMILDFAGNT